MKKDISQELNPARRFVDVASARKADQAKLHRMQNIESPKAEVKREAKPYP
jgi:hypothetical protein